MPGNGASPSQGMIARLMAMIMGSSPDKVSTGQGQDIYLPPEGPSIQQRMDTLMQPREGPLMPSMASPSPTVARDMMQRVTPPSPEMEMAERLRKRNEMLGRLAR